jgi:Leucine-rich repeat (LRR) protein
MVLDMGKNNLKEVPSELKKLPKLIFLYLNHNHLKALPDCVTQIKGLKLLYIKDNPMSINKTQQKSLSHIHNLDLNDSK